MWGCPWNRYWLFLLPPGSLGAAASSRREELWLEGGWDSSSTFSLGFHDDSGSPSRKHSVFITAPGRLVILLVSYQPLVVALLHIVREGFPRRFCLEGIMLS